MDVFPYHAAGSGFLLGASLIFSIGPQNLALINAGLARDNMLLVAASAISPKSCLSAWG